MKKKTIVLIIIFTILTIGAGYGIFQYISINKPQPKETGEGEVTISCVGDSITYGLGVFYDRELSWVSILPKKLGNNYKTVNYGISNRTMMSTGNYPYLNEEIADKFMNAEEDIILFMLGTNDSKICNWNEEIFERDYESFVNKLLEKKGNPKVYIMIPPKLYLEDSGETNPNEKNLIEGVIPTIKRVLERVRDVEVIDLYAVTENHPEWFDDGIHPNKEGNEAIANEIASVIKGTYKK